MINCHLSEDKQQNPHTIDKNDQLSPDTGQTKNLITIDENDHMSPVTGQTKNSNAIDFSNLWLYKDSNLK